MKLKKRLEVIFISILIISTGWSLLGLYQQSRYSKEYNCDEMSYDCAYFFSSLGIPTEVIHGKKIEGFGLHCWVRLFGCIEFESTNLMFMRVSKEFDIEKIEKIN